jgi:hypothetical protein
MIADQIIIRRSSDGIIVFETPEGNYRLTPEDIRNILFYGNRVSVLRDNGGAESKALVWGKRPGFTGARRIFFSTATRSFSIADISFISVVKRKWAAASMFADSQRTAEYVA